MAFRALAPDLELITPIRELSLSRAQEMSFLAERGIHLPAKTGAYSVNEGMWGTSVGGKETHDSWSTLPEAAYPAGVIPSDLKPRTLVLSFEKGRPVAIDGKAVDPVALIAELNAVGQPYGVGRGVHLGDTILGIKGRVGFDAPAAVMLITAHRELEKLVLSGKQLFWKETLGNLYGSLLHEGHFFDPLARDLEGFLTVLAGAGDGRGAADAEPRAIVVEGVRSQHSLMDAKVASYGEANHLWTGAEAAGFAKVYGVAQTLALKVKS